MKKHIILILILSHFASVSSTFANDSVSSGISGKILLPEGWQPRIYLSQIPDFNERYTLSNDWIIDETSIDTNGNFYFNTEFLPEEDRFYRIHVTKVGYPRASLIIGGDDENFQFLIANRNKRIHIKTNNNEVLFHQVIFPYDKVNQGIVLIDQWHQFADSAHFEGSKLKKEFIAGAVQEKMRKLADSTDHILVALFALYQSDYENNVSVNPTFYEEFLDKWKSNPSTYLRVFRSTIPIPKTEANLIWIIGFSLLFFVLGYFSNKLLKPNPKQDPIALLSIQERRIYNLLKEGKSNKEISEECNIGLSTAKTHVSNILSKLNVKSRKNIFDVK